jgi:hypothetical protein
LLQHTGIAPEKYITRLNAYPESFGLFTGGTPADWATQSHRIARDIAYVIPSGPDASQRYYIANLDPLRNQIMYAGARLARTLNHLIGGAPVPPPSKRPQQQPVATSSSNDDVSPTINPAQKQPVVNGFAEWFDIQQKRPWFWIVTATGGAIATYLLGMIAILLLAWKRGSQFVSRSRLRKAALAPLPLQPAAARWALFIGYRSRVGRRSDVMTVSSTYYGLPALIDLTTTILPDLTGDRLHDAIAANISEKRPLFIVGTGGAGKSTLLARLAYLGVTGRLPATLHGFTPILVAAADYSGDLVRAIAAALRDRDGVNISDDREAVVDLLQSGRFLILFDGLSEVFGDQQEAMREILRTATGADLQSCRVLIATRRIEDDIGGARVLELQPLTEAVIETILDHLAPTQAARNRIREQVKSFGGGAIEPLLFAMMVEGSDESEVARTRAKLYERYFRAQLKIRNEDAWLGWRDALESLAARFVLPAGRRGFGGTRVQVIDFLSGRREGAPDEESTPSRLRRVYHVEVRDELGILNTLASAGILVRDRRVRFAHDTFEEYFLASAIIACIEEGRWSTPAWLREPGRDRDFASVTDFVTELAADDNVRRQYLADGLLEQFTSREGVSSDPLVSDTIIFTRGDHDRLPTMEIPFPEVDEDENITEASSSIVERTVQSSEATPTPAAAAPSDAYEAFEPESRTMFSLLPKPLPPFTCSAHSKAGDPAIHLGRGSPDDDNYTAVILPFRNDPLSGGRPADAIGVKAVIRAGRERVVTGYWLDSDGPEMNMKPGEADRELVLAFVDINRNVWMLNDGRPRDKIKQNLLYEPKTHGPRAFGMSVELVMGGRVFGTFAYTLMLSEGTPHIQAAAQ